MPEFGRAEQLPFASIRNPGRFGRRAGAAGVVVLDVADVQTAAVTARRGMARVLAARVRETFSLDLPEGPRRVGSEGMSFTWSGPDRWLVMKAGAMKTRLPEELAPVVANVAAVVDQSHAQAILSIRGPKVREALAKGFTIDLHPQVFSTGQTAMTTVSHMAVQITQLTQEPMYEIAVPRSLAGSFWHWLEASAAEFGLEVQASGETDAR